MEYPTADELADRKDVDGLLTLLTDQDPHQRAIAAEAFGLIAEEATDEERAGLRPRISGPLIGAAADGDWPVRQAAVEALSAVGGEAAEECLIRVLKKDEVPSVRTSAALCLGDSSSEKANRALREVFESKDEDEEVQKVAGYALLTEEQRHQVLTAPDRRVLYVLIAFAVIMLAIGVLGLILRG